MTRPITRFILPVIILVITAAACLPSAPVVPTPWPTEHLPTVVALTLAANPPPTKLPATPTLESSATPESVQNPPMSPTPDRVSESPTPVVISGTPDPTVEPTPSPDPLAAAIQILTPGPLSKVISPIRLRSFLTPGADGLVTVELFGEDGRLLARQISRILPPDARRAYINVDIPFEIRAAAETARLQISSLDRFGRLTALSAIHIILLSSGTDVINPAGDLQERLALTSPTLYAQISGGEVNLTGSYSPVNNNPLIIELVRFTGEVVGSKMVTVDYGNGSYRPFTADVPYNISGGTWVRIVIRQLDERIPGTMYLFSREIYLTP